MESKPSTPARSAAGSNHGSPATNAASTKPVLTPRSKVKAMLAALDSDSDDTTHGIVMRSTVSTLPSLVNDTIADAMRRSTHSDEGDVSDVPLPRGRLATRLNLRIAKKALSFDGDSEADAASAYARVRRQLLANDPIETGADETNPGVTKHEAQPMQKRAFGRKKAQTWSENKTHIPGTTPGKKMPEISSPYPSSLPSGNLPNPGENDRPCDDEPDRPDEPSARFLALVTKKRAERKAQEAKKEQERLERCVRQQAHSSEPVSDVEADAEDVEGGRKFIQEARSIRRASKKAVEAINRETQRISRNMQLSHEAKTRKNITKEDLFKRLNFRPSPNATPESEPIDTTPHSGSLPTSEANFARSTPSIAPGSVNSSVHPSEEPAMVWQHATHVEKEALAMKAAPKLLFHIEEMSPLAGEEELPSLDTLLGTPPLMAKGKGKAYMSPIAAASMLPKSRTQNFTQPPIRVKAPHRFQVSVPDSDSDIELIPSDVKNNRALTIFDRTPQRQTQNNARSNIALRALAGLTSPSKKKDVKSLQTQGGMQITLQQRARLQARKERAERIQKLRDRGIDFETTAEREFYQMDVENLLEKARQENDELRKREKEAAKKEGGEKSGVNLDDSSGDESYFDAYDLDEGCEAAEAEKAEITDSGEERKEEEGEEEGEEEDEDEEQEEDEDEEQEEDDGGIRPDDSNVIFDNEADENSEDSEINRKQGHVDRGTVAGDGDSDIVEEQPRAAVSRRKRAVRVLEDDEKADGTLADPDSILYIGDKGKFAADADFAGREIVINPFANGASALKAPPMGLTQAFAATLADSQMNCSPDFDSSTTIVLVPESKLPIISTIPDEHSFVARSQSGPKDLPLSPARELGLLGSIASALDTEDFDTPDPTQDEGIQGISPFTQRFASIPPSTIDTLLLARPIAPHSPILERKGRLRRRGLLRHDSDNEDGTKETEIPDTTQKVRMDGFEAMKAWQQRTKDLGAFNKKKSDAKQMVEEQAEESEDEYAGLGGASDDESGGETDEEIQKMLNDEDVDIDERGVAAFHALV